MVEGVRSPYLETGPPGEAEAAVFVHGYPGSPRDWEDLLARIGQFMRAVAPDLRDLGHTVEAEGAARRLGAFLEETGIRRAHLVLHGLGGLWGLEWAREHPEAFASVTLINADAPQIRQTEHRLTGARRSLERPALVVWGARDPCLPIRYAERQRKIFPDARLVVLEESGRRQFAEDPEAVADEVVLFLRRNLAARRRRGTERRLAGHT